MLAILVSEMITQAARKVILELLYQSDALMTTLWLLQDKLAPQGLIMFIQPTHYLGGLHLLLSCRGWRVCSDGQRDKNPMMASLD